jgi:hypothetical protein
VKPIKLKGWFIICIALSSVSCNSGPPAPPASNTGPESNYTLPDQITLTASAYRDATFGTVINGTTNLPDGTKLGIELMKGERVAAQDFDVFVQSGQFHSAGFRNGTSPLQPGKQRVHIFTNFTPLWQKPSVLNLVGTGGNKLKPSAIIHVEDAQLIDSDKRLEFTTDVAVPSIDAPNKEVAKPSESSSREAQVIQIVKKAVLVVDGRRSSMSVNDGFQFYCTAPGVRMGDGWSAVSIGRDTFNVLLDFIDGVGQGHHEKAMWEVNLTTKQVLYRNKFAKDFSWVPAE